MITINRDICVACGKCRASCEVDAVVVVDGKFQIIAERCAECEACIDGCPVGAIEWRLETYGVKK